MESRIRILLLIAVGLGLGGCSHLRNVWPFHRHAATATTEQGPSSATDTAPIVEPDIVRQQIKVPKIRTSNVELTAGGGLQNVEDYGTYFAADARLAYHIKERFFAEASVGLSRLRAADYTNAQGKLTAFTANQRRVYDYALDLGYDVLPGEVFLGRQKAFPSAVYVVGGVGAIHYGADSFFGANAGLGYRLLINDHMALHIDARDMVTHRNLLGTRHLTNNVESTAGFSVYF